MDNTECLSSIVGKELKKLRKEAGYNLGQFAKLINKSEQQLFRYGRCVNKIDIDTLINSLIILDTDSRPIMKCHYPFYVKRMS